MFSVIVSDESGRSKESSEGKEKDVASITCFNYYFQVDSGTLEAQNSEKEFVMTEYHDGFLAEMLQSHLVKDFCVIGSRVSNMYIFEI